MRTTLVQAGVVRDVLERGAREGRARWDDARAERQRRDRLAALGERVLELIESGEMAEATDDPAIAQLVDELQPGTPGADGDADADDAVSSANWRPADAKAKGGANVWRPDMRSDSIARAEASPPVASRPGAPNLDDDDLDAYMHPDDVPARR